jgi:alkanesulfonate monooxygenase SsuD/methylene tetrahydromethanopterin reductase-like flavin-dependent oxidoreductase (luciferase family)
VGELAYGGDETGANEMACSIDKNGGYSMRFAINLPNGRECGYPRKLAEFALLAEEAGWDAVFLEDYIIWQGHNDAPTFDPWVALAAMASSTSSIRLGTMVTPIARRRPWKLARECVTLDHLSGGRLILGIGVGDTQIDTSFTRFGEVVDVRQRALMVDEAIELLARLWSGEEVTYDGQFYHLEGVRLLPRPLQKPRIPIWIGGVWPLKGPTQRALRWDGACLYKLPPEEEFTPQDVRDLVELAYTHRDPDAPFDIVVGHASWQRAEDAKREREHIASLAEAGATWWSQYIAPDSEKVMRKYIEEGPLRVS